MLPVGKGKSLRGNEAEILKRKKVMTTTTAIKQSLKKRLIKTNTLGFAVTTVLNQHV